MYDKKGQRIQDTAPQTQLPSFLFTYQIRLIYRYQCLGFRWFVHASTMAALPLPASPRHCLVWYSLLICREGEGGGGAEASLIHWGIYKA